jgi:type IV pilus assembly protein PilN
VIRINLLPGTKRSLKSADAGKGGAAGGQGSPFWPIVYLGMAGAACGVFGFLYFRLDGQLTEKQRVNADLQQQIARVQSESAQLAELQAKLQASLDLENLVAELQRARLGPTRVLLEISKILSEGANAGPTIDPQRLEQMRRENPLAGYNPGWDARRLWLTSFIEDQRNCKVAGVGKTNEDVAEFLARLSLSELFEDVTLQRTQATTDTGTGLPLISFELTCKVIY